MNTARAYMLILRKTALTPFVIYLLMTMLGNKIELHAISYDDANAYKLAIVATVLVGTPVLSLLYYMRFLRAPSSSVLRTLPVSCRALDGAEWLVYVILWPMIETLAVAVGAHRFAHNTPDSASWSNDALLLFGMFTVANHATFYTAATVSAEMELRALLVGATAFVLGVTLGNAPVLLNPYLGIVWIGAAVPLSYCRKSHLRDIHSSSKDSYRSTVLEADITAVFDGTTDEYVPGRRAHAIPPPLPRSAAMSIAMEPDASNHAVSALPRIPHVLYSRLFRLVFWASALTLAALSFATFAFYNAPTGQFSSAGVAVATACIAFALVLSFEQPRVHVYRTLPLSFRARCAYLLLIAFAPTSLIFLVLAPILLFLFGATVPDVFTGYVLAVSLQLNLLSFCAPNLQNEISRESTPEQPYTVLQSVRMITRTVIGIFVYVIAVAAPLAHWIIPLATLLMALVGVLNFYRYQYRTRGG